MSILITATIPLFVNNKSSPLQGKGILSPPVLSASSVRLSYLAPPKEKEEGHKITQSVLKKGHSIRTSTTHTIARLRPALTEPTPQNTCTPPTFTVGMCQGSCPEVGSGAGTSRAGGPKRPKAPPKGGTP